MTEAFTPDDEATADAAVWLSRLGDGEPSAQEGLAFDAWLAAAPENGAAFARAVGVLHDLDAHAREVLAQIDAKAAPAAPRRAYRSRPAPRRRRISAGWWATGAGALLAAGLAVVVMPPELVRPASVQSYATAKGQHQRVALADGSVIDLDAETRLRVSFQGSQRHVALAEGQAIFDVVHDARRPFVVEAAGRLIRDVGTQFDVRARGGQLTVTVARGRVEVTPDAPGAAVEGQDVLLGPGQRFELDAPAAAPQLSAVDPQETFSWRSGRLVYRNRPLGEVVADLNRQFVEQTTIADPQLAKLPITGVIVLDNPRAVMSRLSLMLPIRTVPSDKGLMLLRK
jgi:transmembrane sensor